MKTFRKVVIVRNVRNNVQNFALICLFMIRVKKKTTTTVDNPINGLNLRKLDKRRLLTQYCSSLCFLLQVFHVNSKTFLDSWSAHEVHKVLDVRFLHLQQLSDSIVSQLLLRQESRHSYNTEIL